MGLDLNHFAPVIKNTENGYLDYFELEQLSGYPEYIELHSRFIVEKDFDEFGKSKVIYFQSKGYQRKGMNGRFYTDFGNDSLHFDLQSVKNAYHYLERDHISSLEELQENFQKNFIDNFTEGESIFFVSW